MSSKLDQLRKKREELRAAADEILTRSAQEERDLTLEEAAQHRDRVGELRELDDEIEQHLERQVAEVRAQATRQPDTKSEYPAGEWLIRSLQESGGLQTRALTGDAGAGANFTPTDFPNRFFELLTAQSVGLRSGFTVIPTDRDVLTIPKLTADVTSAWVAQAGTISSTDLTSSTVTATPRKLAAIEQVANEALDDSVPSLADIIGRSLIRSIGLKADLGFFEGSGTPPEITGLKNQGSIQTETSLGANGATPTNFDQIAASIGLLETANANATAIVMHPRTWGVMLKFKAQSGGVLPALVDQTGSAGGVPSRSIYGVPVYLTSQLSITETRGTSTDTSSVYVYQADQVVVVRRAETSVVRDSSRLFNSDQSEIRAIARLDLVLPNPTAVVRSVGFRP
jgi:HK97 family phage major capsid protein